MVESEQQFRRAGQVWTAGHCAALACLLEVTVPKPGNVHRGADFEDTTFADFVLAGQILGNTIDTAAEIELGETVYRAVSSTRTATNNNPNLGIILLLIPLARLAQSGSVISTTTMENLLNSLSSTDGQRYYEAIRLASPGGLGASEYSDVRTESEPDVLQAMRSASHRDLIAREYATHFSGVINDFGPILKSHLESLESLEKGVIATHVELISQLGDSLILRKCGPEIAKRAQSMAAKAMEKLAFGWKPFERAVAEMDFWMRSDGNRRNPGATADLIAATLFVQLWQGKIVPGLNIAPQFE